MRGAILQPEQRLHLEHRKLGVHGVHAVSGFLQVEHDRPRSGTNRLSKLFYLLPFGQQDYPRIV